MKIIIYEYFQHFMPTGIGWANGFFELGHEIATVRKSEVPIDRFPAEANLIIYFDLPTDNAEIDKIKQYKDNNPDCKIIGIASLPKENFYRYRGVVDFWCGLAYQHSFAEKSFNELGFSYYNIPMGSDPTVFFPISNTGKMFDISFVGTFGEHGHGDRDQEYYLYPALRDKKLVPYYAGFSWEGSQLMATYPQHLNEVYNTTKVNLNFHYPFEKEESNLNNMSRIDLNSRNFDIALSGNFQLCDHPLVGELMQGSVIIGTKENWMDLIYYYKDREEERRHLGQLSRNIALNHHTWKHRMNVVLNILSERGI